VFKKFLKNKITASIFIAFAVSIIFGLLILSNPLNKLHLKLSDSLYTYQNPSDEIVIIAIDEDSTETKPLGLGGFSQWSRTNYIDLLDVLEEETPSVIAFDIIFQRRTEEISFEEIQLMRAEIDDEGTNKEKLEAYEELIGSISDIRKSQVDLDFASKLTEFENIVLAFNSNQTNPNPAIYPLKKFSQVSTLADVGSELDEDKVLRSFPTTFYDENSETWYDDFGTAIAKKHLEVETIYVPLEEEGLLVNYFGDTDSYNYIPFIDVINKDFPTGAFKDKIVLIGLTEFQDINDAYATPVDKELPMPGVEIRANEIQTILDGKFLLNQGKMMQIFSIFLISAALAIILNYLAISLSVILVFAAIGLYTYSAHFFFARGTIINMIYPYLAIVATYIASWMYRYLISDKSKREITSAFGHYVSDELVNQISKNPDMVKLGGERKEVTVLFSDIKGSTTHSENTAIEKWVSQINEYFTVMESVIKRSGGTLDKYEGDAIMAFWNAPVSQADHIVRAYAAAVGMNQALGELHKKWQGEGKPLIEMRIGINSGEAIVGNFGSVNRFDYTVMGDTVNTASRLESAANKTYGTSMIVAGAQPNPQFIFRELDKVLLPGKNTPVTLYELICLAPQASNAINQNISNYAEGLTAYRSKDFAKAEESFGKIIDDAPASVMLERCKILNTGKQVPGLDENMIFRIEHK
jgi:class 3 adenylate cyclase/CHASE2 domain-containing sensor protein